MLARMVRVAVLALSVVWTAAPQEDTARIWREYVQWVKQSGNYENVEARYRSKLVGEGFSEKQAGERIALLQRLAGEHREDSWTLNFNRLYSAAQQTVFTTQPNAFLVSNVEKLKPGKALDVSMGEGRNAVFLATKGWQVTGFDIAQEGLKAARAAAAKGRSRMRPHPYEMCSRLGACYASTFFAASFHRMRRPSLRERLASCVTSAA